MSVQTVVQLPSLTHEQGSGAPSHSGMAVEGPAKGDSLAFTGFCGRLGAEGSTPNRSWFMPQFTGSYTLLSNGGIVLTTQPITPDVDDDRREARNFRQ